MHVFRYLAVGVLLVVAVMVIGYLLLLRPDIPYATLEQRYAAPTSHYIDLPDGVRMHYRDEGNPSGPVLVLVHGYSASAADWDPWAKALGDKYRIIAPDLPGHGLTRAPKGFKVTPTVQVATVEDLAEKLNLPRFVIVGNSMGGGVAWRYALAHPERVSGLVLVDAAGWPSIAGGNGALVFALLDNPLSRALIKNLDNRALIRQGLEAAFFDPRLVTPALVNRYASLARAPGHRDILLQRPWSPGDLATPAKLSAIKVPTLIMVGANDLLIPASDGQRFADAIPGATLILYPGVGHVPMEQIPARSATDLRNWLAAKVAGW